MKRAAKHKEQPTAELARSYLGSCSRALAYAHLTSALSLCSTFLDSVAIDINCVEIYWFFQSIFVLIKQIVITEWKLIIDVYLHLRLSAWAWLATARTTSKQRLADNFIIFVVLRVVVDVFTQNHRTDLSLLINNSMNCWMFVVCCLSAQMKMNRFG